MGLSIIYNRILKERIMKKSMSLPSLNTTITIPATMKRNVSTGSLSSMDIEPVLSPVPISSDLEMVAVRFPLHKVIECSVTSFPKNLIKPNIDEIKDFGVCVAEPMEIDSQEKGILSKASRYVWFERAMCQEELKERYMNLYSRIRRRNKNKIS
jgi:predicted HTH domain antitoxin